MDSFYVVGDIEENDRTFSEAVECVGMAREKLIVFLGDIYCARDIGKTVLHIAELLYRLGIPIENKIDEAYDPCSHTEEETYYFCKKIQQAFDELYKSKFINLATSTSRFKKADGFDEFVSSNIRPTTERAIFLFGNKETNLLNDLHRLKEMNIIDGKFIANYKYKFRHQKYTSSFECTLPELNVLYTYLSKARHFYIHGDTLLTHIYLRGRCLLKDAKLKSVKRIISGHNRCFGYFADSVCPNVNVNMLDLSHEKICEVKNYMLVHSDIVIYFTNSSLVRKYINTITLSANKTFLSYLKNVSAMELYELYIRDVKRKKQSGGKLSLVRSPKSTA